MNTATVVLNEVEVKKAIEAYVLKSWPDMEVTCIGLTSTMGGDQREPYQVFKQASIQIKQVGARK